jgi:hypothetical protein
MKNSELKVVLREMTACIAALAEKQNTIFEMLSALPQYDENAGNLKAYAKPDLKKIDNLKTLVNQLPAD